MRFCNAALEGLAHLESPARTNNMLGFETDLAEHYSQVATYMRLLGMVPPFARNASGAVTGFVLHQYGRDRPATKIR